MKQRSIVQWAYLFPLSLVVCVAMWHSGIGSLFLLMCPLSSSAATCERRLSQSKPKNQVIRLNLVTFSKVILDGTVRPLHGTLAHVYSFRLSMISGCLHDEAHQKQQQQQQRSLGVVDCSLGCRAFDRTVGSTSPLPLLCNIFKITISSQLKKFSTLYELRKLWATNVN
jgi:hypothetical protein